MYCLFEISTAALLSVLYVCFVRLSSWNCENRDDTRTVLRRSFGASLACVVSGYLCSSWKPNDDISFLTFVGLRLDGLLPAIIIPLLCTTILFAGSILLQIWDGSVALLIDKKYWSKMSTNACFWRNNIVAPVTEEWTFRSCALPILLTCLSPTASALIGPMFFSLAHYHHIFELMKRNYTIQESILTCTFQAFYTYLFGIYASFLYIRTKHLIAVVLCHSFCNCMGFPPVDEIMNLKKNRKIIVICTYFFGFICWLYLINNLTYPMFSL